MVLCRQLRAAAFNTGVRSVNTGIFTPVSTVLVRAVDTFFVDDLKPGLHDGIRIDWIGEHFRANFGGLVVNSAPGIMLGLYRLDAEAHDLPAPRRQGIMEREDEFVQAVIGLGQLWSAISCIGTRNNRYVAYAHGKNGICGVSAGWSNGGMFGIESGPLNRPYSWGPGAYFLFP